MRAVLQNAKTASVTVDGQVVGKIDRPGLMVLVAAHRDDTAADAEKMARRIRDLRIMDSDQGLDAPQVSLAQTGAPALLISQFTLYGRTKKGTRPSWSDAAPGPVAEPLFNMVVDALRAAGTEVATGVFGAEMEVALVNNGPVTVIVDTRE